MFLLKQATTTLPMNIKLQFFLALWNKQVLLGTTRSHFEKLVRKKVLNSTHYVSALHMTAYLISRKGLWAIARILWRNFRDHESTNEQVTHTALLSRQTCLVHDQLQEKYFPSLATNPLH